MHGKTELPPAVKVKATLDTMTERPFIIPQKEKQVRFTIFPTSPTLIPMDEEDEDGEPIAPTTSQAVPYERKILDPQTPIFRTKESKAAFLATLPTAIQLQLDQPFGKDNLNQCFYLQKTGKMALLLLYKSGFMSNTVKKKLERAFPPARQLNQIVKLYQNVDFQSMKGFQEGWQAQTELSKPQRDMTTACLIHFNLSLPAMVRWIGGPHVAEHRDNEAIFSRLKKTCESEVYHQLVRIFTQGSPTFVNAECSQQNYQAYKEYGNHSTINDNQAMVTKTLLKEVKRGCSLMLDPDIMDFLENTKQTPHGILYLDHPYKSPRVVCDSSCRPKAWCEAINDWTSKKTEPKLIFAGAFVATLTWLWNLRIEYPEEDIYVCDDDASNAFKQVKYPPNLAGLHCKVVDGTLFVDTGQTFGDATSPSNWEPIAICRSQHAQALWHQTDTIERALPLLPPIRHQEPPTMDEVKTFVKANRDSFNTGVRDEHGNRKPPPYRHHVDDNLYGDIAQHLERTVCASALAIYDILGYPDGRQVEALSLEKLDTMYRPQRTVVGYRLDTRAMTVSLTQYKRDQTALVIDPWLTTPTFTLIQGAELCGKLESASTCCRHIRPYYHSVQNTIREVLTVKWKAIQAIYKRKGKDKIREMFDLPKHLERRLVPLIARDKARLLWHSNSKFDIPDQVKQILKLLQDWLRDPAVKWERSIAHWIIRDATFVSAGDASQVAGGGLSTELQYWFDVHWSERVKQGCRRDPKHPEYIHINVLEFIVVVIQVAAAITALENGYAQSVTKSQLPDIPHLLVWTDNTASKSWANKLTTASRKAQPLLGILSSLLKRSNVGFRTEHIAGITNDGPDFISRPELANEIALSHFARAQQIITNDTRLKSWHYFRASHEFTSLIASMLFTERWAAPPKLPKILGHFEPTVSISSPFVSI